MATSAPPAAPAKAEAAAPPLNEANIAQALSFLKDARVVSTTSARKLEFLKKKGLSLPEIAEAFKRAYPQSNEWQEILAVRYLILLFFLLAERHYSSPARLRAMSRPPPR